MTLEVKPWNELSRKEINDIFSLRSEVFIVEQECAYQDVDGKDKQADHVMLHVDNELVGYTRVFSENKEQTGIIICGSGNGVIMVANKYNGVRAAICWNKELASLSRQHTNANVLSLPARFLTTKEAIEIVDVFLTTDFEGGRHERRVNKINK